MNHSRSAIFLLFFFLMLVGSGCGKKTPPFLPKKAFAVKIGDLKGEWIKGDLFLRGDIQGPGAPEKAVGLVRGGRIYYARYPIEDPPCEGCPIEYQGYHEFGAGVIKDEGFLIKVPVGLKGQIGFFRVHLIGPGGVVGPPSNRIRVVVE